MRGRIVLVPALGPRPGANCCRRPPTLPLLGLALLKIERKTFLMNCLKSLLVDDVMSYVPLNS